MEVSTYIYRVFFEKLFVAPKDDVDWAFLSWMMGDFEFEEKSCSCFCNVFCIFQIFVIITWLSIFIPILVRGHLLWVKIGPLVARHLTVLSIQIYHIHTNHDPLENLLRQRCYLWIFRSDGRTNVPATSTRSWPWGLLMGVQGQRTVLVMGNAFMKQEMIWWEDWRLDTHVMLPDSESWPNFFV